MAAGRPLAFQEVMRRFGRARDIERLRVEQPVQLFAFDLIGIDGRLLIDEPYEERYAALSEVASAPGIERASRILPADVAAGNQFYARAIADGYEGIVAKALASHYMPGARGRGWVKIKTARTLDLVIVAADWGYGRRHGWLSNYHLAARDERVGRLRRSRQDFQGAHRRRLSRDDRAAGRAQDCRRTRHCDRAAGGRGRGRVQRHSAQSEV